mmetsp:Transcript_24107/g.37857  ORF Transcript_24107/g.37857 Transcript_24107/m.37857 type:complete len:167 (+) Transcript_24107:143-643(+)
MVIPQLRVEALSGLFVCIVGASAFNSFAPQLPMSCVPSAIAPLTPLGCGSFRARSLYRQISSRKSPRLQGSSGFLDLRMSNQFELEGTIKHIGEVQTFPSGFSKREFVIQTDEVYAQDVKFEVYKDKCSMLNEYALEDKVHVSFNIKGNNWQGKYYVNLNVLSPLP